VNDNGEQNGQIAKFVGRLLDIADLLYEMLRESRERRDLLLEEEILEREQGLYMDHDFDWEFQEERR
jgi:hypothetical protein